MCTLPPKIICSKYIFGCIMLHLIPSRYILNEMDPQSERKRQLQITILKVSGSKMLLRNAQAPGEAYLHSRSNCRARLVCLFLTVGLI